MDLPVSSGQLTCCEQDVCLLSLQLQPPPPPPPPPLLLLLLLPGTSAGFWLGGQCPLAA